MGENYAVILAGGRGERLWPVGRSEKPKQFLSLAGQMPLLAQTYKRVLNLVPRRNILVMTSADYVELCRETLPDMVEDNIISEPESKNTAACAALAAAHIARRCVDIEQTSMLLLPSDHAINDTAAFRKDVRLALRLCCVNDCVTLGIRPRYAATGFGYIERGTRIKNAPKSFHVVRFREKPDALTAEGFYLSGSFYWNSGMFAWHLPQLIHAFERHSPAHATLIKRLRAVSARSLSATTKRLFEKIDNISIDYALLEKMQNIAVIQASFDWNDLGSMDAVGQLIKGDAQGNRLYCAQFVGIDSHNTTIYTDHPCLVAGIGLENMVVIEDRDVLFIAPADRLQEIKPLLQKLRSKAKFKKYL